MKRRIYRQSTMEASIGFFALCCPRVRAQAVCLLAFPLACLLIPLLGTTQPAEAVTLKQTLENAYEGNFQIKKQRLMVRSIMEDLHQARGGWLPNLEASSRVGATDSRSTAPFYPSRSIQKREYFGGQVLLTQPLWLGGKTFAQVKGAKQRIRAAGFELAYTEQNGLLESAIAHLEVVKNAEIVRLSKSSLRVLESHLTATRDRFEIGQGNYTDVAQATARVAAAKAELVAAEGSLRAGKANYLEVVGSPFYGDGESGNSPTRNSPTGNSTGTPATDSASHLASISGDSIGWVEASFPTSVVAVKDKMHSQNPLLQALRTYEEAARTNIDINRADFFPSLNLEASSSRSVDEGFENSVAEESKVGLNVRVPIYQAGVVDSKVRQSKELLQIQSTERELTRRNLEKQITARWSDYNSSKAAVEFHRSQIEANKIALEGVEAELATGSRTLLDVLDAQNELLASQIALVESNTAYLIGGFSLMTLAGEFNPTRLNLAVEETALPPYNLDWKLWGTEIEEP